MAAFPLLILLRSSLIELGPFDKIGIDLKASDEEQRIVSGFHSGWQRSYLIQTAFTVKNKAEKQFSQSESAEGIGPPLGSASQVADYFRRSLDDSCRVRTRAWEFIKPT